MRSPLEALDLPLGPRSLNVEHPVALIERAAAVLIIEQHQHKRRMSATRTHDKTSASFSAEPMFMSVAIASGKFPIAARQRHGTDRAGL
jgi:hypothetical protein